MIKLQYWSNEKWIDCGEFHHEGTAWVSLGGDDLNYRTVDKETGVTLSDRREPKK